MSYDLIKLRSSFAKARENSLLMKAKLVSFEARLTNLGAQIQPLKDSTITYSRAQANIQDTLKEITKTYDLFRIAEETKIAIKRGYANVKNDYHKEQEFFQALERLSEAKQFFESHHDIKSSSTVLTTVNTLYGMAVGELLNELERLILPLGPCIQQRASSDQADKSRSENSINHEQRRRYEAVNPISKEVLKRVHPIIEALEKNRCYSYLDIYKGVRIAQIKAELNNFEKLHLNHLTSAALLKDMPYQKDDEMGVPLTNYLRHGILILSGEAELWGSIFSATEASVRIYVSLCEAVLAGIQRVLSPILENDAPSAGSHSCLKQVNMFLSRLDATESFIECYNELIAVCEPDARKASTASLTVTALRDALLEVCVESMEVVLESSLDTGPAFTPNINARLKSSATGTDLSDFYLGQSTAEALELLPMTANVLHCCHELSKFGTTYSWVLDYAGDISLSIPEVARSLTSMAACLIENLLLNLDERALLMKAAIRSATARIDRSSKKDATQSTFGAAANRRRSLESNLQTHNLFDNGDKQAETLLMDACCFVFLCNNLHSIHQFMTEQKINMSLIGSSYLETVARKLTSAQDSFSDCIVAAVAMGPLDMGEFNRLYSAGAAMKDKQAGGRLLKAKFALFTSGMDAMLNIQGVWRVASPTLRSALSAALVHRICPAYHEFYRNYSVVQFSKTHMREYLKYPPQLVESTLKGYFGTR